MPVLHKYKGKEKYYVLTSISGKIVTFQLTNEGHLKLLEAGINNEERFGRALLFDLYRTGDAFTHLDPGIYNTLKTLDSRLRTSGMTD